MSQQFKEINQNNTGTPTKHGGDDLDKSHRWMNGGVGFDPVILGSPLGVPDAMFFLVDPVTGKRAYIRTGSLSADTDWYLPIGTGWIDNYLKNRFVNEQIFQKFVSFKKITPPANPDADHLTIWADQATGQIMVKDSTGVAQAIFADIAAVANIGTTGVSVYDSKVSSTVNLRSINSLSDSITVAHNETTHAIDLNFVPAELLFEDIGGTLTSGQIPTLSTGHLPSSALLDSENTTITGEFKFDKQLQLKQLTTHPTPSTGYVTFYANEDNNLYYKNSAGSQFKLLYNTDLDNTVPLPPAGYVSGYWQGTNEDGVGLLSDMTSIADSGYLMTDYHDLTTGKFGQEWATDESGTDNCIGLVTTKTNVLYRDANPTIWINFGVDISAAPTTSQLFLGVADIGTQTGIWDNADPLNSPQDGFMLCKRAADTNWQIGRNDGSGAGTYDNTGNFPAVDTGYHSLKIMGDNNNDRWGMSFDGGSMVWKTDDDPIEERNLGIACIFQATSGTQLRKLRIFDITVWRKKF